LNSGGEWGIRNAASGGRDEALEKDKRSQTGRRKEARGKDNKNHARLKKTAVGTRERPPSSRALRGADPHTFVGPGDEIATAISD
jgi:hypothetical protein